MSFKYMFKVISYSTAWYLQCTCSQFSAVFLEDGREVTRCRENMQQRLWWFLLLFLHPDGGYTHTGHNLNTVSHTVFPLSQMDHDPRNPTYISSQGPLPTTVADFWQVILTSIHCGLSSFTDFFIQRWGYWKNHYVYILYLYLFFLCKLQNTAWFFLVKSRVPKLVFLWF